MKVGLLDADIYGPSLPKLLNKNVKPEIENKSFLPIVVKGFKTMYQGQYFNQTVKGFEKYGYNIHFKIITDNH